jgi:Na+/H+ antiporter NhaD/arsenite permease-like protein
MEQPSFVPSLIWVIPFACLLLSIAILPLAAPGFWESNLRKLVVSAVLMAPVIGLYLAHAPAVFVHTARDYLSFIILLGSLFVTSGGVALRGDLEARPWVNTTFLAVGGLFASFIGTTGASILFIRPLLHTNAERRYVVHTVVFFIFLVSNIGGCLTPLGDPPLFLGYLAGVPFWWTFRLTPMWMFTMAIVLAIYFVWDTRLHRKESLGSLGRDATKTLPFTVEGKVNLLLLGGIVSAAALLPAPWRDFAMVLFAGASWVCTPPQVHRINHFTLHPIVEVAVVFLGIFFTMIPALTLLHARGAELGVHHAWQYFWATGILSALLDNAPTYLAFLAVGQGQNLTPEVAGVPHAILEAISAGAVFMGGLTYIGNGPNFMVRSIAERRGIKMPGFGGYMLYSGAILIPVFIVVTLVFFRG